MELYENGYLMHYGTPRHSGRYPYGSGEHPFQHVDDFLGRVERLKQEGLTEKEIAEYIGLTTTELRIQKSLAKYEKRSEEVSEAKRLREQGYSLDAIAKKMGYENDSSIRSLLNESAENRMNQAMKTAEFLKKQVDEKGMIDVGSGVEQSLNISKEKMREALYILELEGYNTFGGGVPQVTNKGKQTNLKVLCPPDTPYKTKIINGKETKVSNAIYDFDNIHTITDYISHDGGDTFDPKFVYPKSMDSSRIKINYSEDGGANKDGVIEIRRGVDDLSLGNSHYAQVRILVDDDKYLKGMAVYSDDIPPGVDVVFNTNKSKGTPIEKVLKPVKRDKDGNIDRDNPFGSLIKEGVIDPTDPLSSEGGQSYYYDKDGKKQLSLINKRSEEGDWGEWSNKLPSQFLAKQPLALINRQLNLAASEKDAEFNEIKSLTNPTVKKQLLESFANDCDSAAVHLKAAALPRQSYQVILPLTTLKDNEVYAPNYRDGETVALIRYPHGGTFEIPILRVNNKNSEGNSIIGSNPKDAVGINSNVASRLSGADFDGDTVMVIPCNSTRSSVKITSKNPLKGLENFDPKVEYGGKPEGTFKQMTKAGTQREMGKITNLITDMTLKGAPDDELARAVRHSMVIIDAEKHKLDYKQSEKDNGIEELKKLYQERIDDDGNVSRGVSTLISSAKSPVYVPKRQGSPKISSDGSLEYKTSENSFYVDKNGKKVQRLQKSSKMAETKDARILSSGTPQEDAYAEYANHMKSLANQARLELVSTPRLAYSPSARKVYQSEYDSLVSKLKLSESNAPKERMAQLIANSVVNAKKESYPDLTTKELKKISQQALTSARIKVGAARTPISITDREWEAIQAGAVTDNILSQILKHTDLDAIRERATPRRNSLEISQAKQDKIAAMKQQGYTTSEIADATGVSTSTVRKYL